MEKCCACGGGVEHQCYEGQVCNQPEKLPIDDHAACIADKTSSFSGYECVTENTCDYTLKITCPGKSSYWHYNPGGCCQLPPSSFSPEICQGACTVMKV